MPPCERSNTRAEQTLGPCERNSTRAEQSFGGASTWQSYCVATQTTRLSSDLAKLRRGCAPIVSNSYMTKAMQRSSDLVKRGYITTSCAPQLRLGEARIHKLFSSAPTWQHYGVAT